MSDRNSTPKLSGKSALIAYALIGAAAIIFDLTTDRSFGALMLSVLPISTIAVLCLLVGPWLTWGSRISALRNWFVGAGLVLAISLGFSSLGAEQAKTGEIVFTYAVLLLAAPASLVLPVAITWVTPLLPGEAVWRMLFAWVLCVGIGWLQWCFSNWVYSRLRL